MVAIGWLLFFHFVADFLLQSREMGKKKSQEFMWLLQHLIIQFMVMYIGSLLLFEGRVAFRLALLNAIIHGVIDWNIWRGYKWTVHRRISKEIDDRMVALFDDKADKNAEYRKISYDLRAEKWEYWEDHWFYVTIGMDQCLHALTILTLIGILC